jgi:hypothetical protein
MISFHSEFSIIAKNCIQAMTGFRFSEGGELTHGSLVVDGNDVGVISTLYKFAEEGGSEEIWAGAPFIQTVFKIVKDINSALFDVDREKLDDYNLLLYIRTYLVKGEIIASPYKSQDRWSRKYSKNIELCISSEDLESFKKLNPNISDKKKCAAEIAVGKYWPIRSHQYRRSIAVHFKRMNLVNNNHLAYQFKHFSRTLADWYSDGYLNENHIVLTVSEDFAEEIDKANLDYDADLAMRLQDNDNLYGGGGELLMEQSLKGVKFKKFKSFGAVRRLMKQGKLHIASLGNGFYCMNGSQCEFRSMVQVSNCDTNCQNIVADQESIPVWIKRYKHFSSLLEDAQLRNDNPANITYLQLEYEFYSNVLQHYQIIEVD